MPPHLTAAAPVSSNPLRAARAHALGFKRIHSHHYWDVHNDPCRALGELESEMVEILGPSVCELDPSSPESKAAGLKLRRLLEREVSDHTASMERRRLRERDLQVPVCESV